MFMFTWLKCNRFGFLQINITSCIILNIIRLYQNDWLSQTFEQGTAKLFFVVVSACKDFKASPWAARATYELKMIAEESQWLKVLDQLDQSSSYRCYSSRIFHCDRSQCCFWVAGRSSSTVHCQHGSWQAMFGPRNELLHESWTLLG